MSQPSAAGMAGGSAVEKSRLHRPLWGLCFALLALSTLGCEPRGYEPDLENFIASAPVSFERIGLGQQATVTDTIEVAVREAAVWDTLAAQFRPLQPFEPVDFEQTMVLLVGLPVESGGHTVIFDFIEKVDTAIVAYYNVLEPNVDCVTVEAAAVAFQAVRVPQDATPVHFERQIERYSCEL
ncbi:MAG: hypothetical protein AAF730_12725 [Bacteroidota bacterium]